MRRPITLTVDALAIGADDHGLVAPVPASAAG
jgi:hypothetical protein